MSRLEYGFKRAVTEIIGGFISSLILDGFVESGAIPVSYMLLFHILNVVGTVTLILVMPFWATTYIIGWFFGLFILSGSGLVNGLDFLFYFVPLLFVLGWRFFKSHDSGD